MQLHYSQRPDSQKSSHFGWRFIAFLVCISTTVGLFTGMVLYVRYSHGVIAGPGYLQVDLKSLSDFQFDEQSATLMNVPPEFRALEGKNVALDGFIIHPTTIGDRTVAFQFQYDLSHAGRDLPRVQERVYVTVPPNKTVVDPPSSVEVRIVGKLHVNICRDPTTGRIVHLYSMDLDHIQPL